MESYLPYRNPESRVNLEETIDVFALPEAKLLVGSDIKASPENHTHNLYTERKRTLCSINILNYLRQGGDTNYAKLTAAQNDAIKLTRQEFDDFHNWFTKTLPDEHSINLMRYIMLIHDIGKNQCVVSAVIHEQEECDSIDHDEVMRRLLSPAYKRQRAELLPSFDLFDPTNQQAICDVLNIKLNLGQFIQAEAPAGALKESLEIQEPTRSLYIMHALLDIAGAAGQVNPESSLILTSSMYNQMIAAISTLTDPSLTPEEVYQHYLGKRASRFGIASADIDDLIHNKLYCEEPCVRLACMLRYDTPEEFQTLMNAFRGLPEPVQEILHAELTRTGYHDRATLPYYGPALLKGLTDYNDLPTTLTYFAHVLQEALIADKDARKAGETGVITADLSSIAQAANQGKLDPRQDELRFHHSGEMLIAERRQIPSIQVNHLPTFDRDKFYGKRVLYIGMGGGSDGIQAAMLSKLQQDTGATPVAIVSVRADTKPLAHTGRSIGQAIVEITPQTTKIGNWRFLEDIIAKDDYVATVYLLNSTKPEMIALDIQALIYEPRAYTIIGVDTGGDVLYRANTEVDSVTSTPDQDYAVLTALHELNKSTGNSSLDIYTAIVAPGVDTPDYANEILESSRAQRIGVTPDDIDAINETYAHWRMDGSASEEGLYGKTPLAWLAALNGRYGLQSLALPKSNAVSTHNPWRIFMNIRPSTASIVVAKADRLYKVVSKA